MMLESDLGVALFHYLGKMGAANLFRQVSSVDITTPLLRNRMAALIFPVVGQFESWDDGK
jgi:hypothetical protein